MVRKSAFAISYVFLIAFVALGMARMALAQSSGGAAAGSSGGNRDIGRDTSPLNPENSFDVLLHPPDKKEDKAYNVFKAVADTDVAKKIQAGENFVKAYPSSELVRYIYPYLVVGYIQTGQIDKGIAAAQKDFEVNPKDFRTMAVVSQTLARTYAPTAPNAEEQLVKAERYGKKALEGVATLAKPEGATDEAFAQMKTETEAMAHGGLGLVQVRRSKYAEAIPDLEKATSLNPADQTNFYVLGMADANVKRFLEAAEAFTKCATLSGHLQQQCSDSAKDAKKSAGN